MRPYWAARIQRASRLAKKALAVPEEGGKGGHGLQNLGTIAGIAEGASALAAPFIGGYTPGLAVTEVKDGPFATEDEARAKHGGVLPINTKLVKMAPRGNEGELWYLVNRTPVITGRDLRNARAGTDEFRKWETSFSLSQEGARKFERFTGENIGNRLAVTLDNRIRSVATIQNRISDQGRINDIGNEQEASDLALVLRSGSLPAGIQYLEERRSGASLGYRLDSRRALSRDSRVCWR